MTGAGARDGFRLASATAHGMTTPSGEYTIPREAGRTLRTVVLLASLVVIIAGLRAARPVLTPLALAAFVAAVSFPVVSYLRAQGVRLSLAIIATVLLDALIVSLFIWIVVETVADFRVELPAYITRGQALEAAARARLETWGLVLPPEFYSSLIQPQRMVDYVTIAARNITSWLSLVFLLLLYLVFILLEAVQLPSKLSTVLGPRARAITVGSAVLAQVQRYLALKTLISIATGVAIGVGAALLGVDFAPFWGLLAFVLNYIPNIGSIIAAIPAMAVALLQLGVQHSLALGAVYLIVNMLLGNIADPILIGRQLRLSPIVILVSLVFWGWTWGVIGAFLAVPLTISLRVALQTSERWATLAALMGPVDGRAEARLVRSQATDPG
ncbi:MAG TPA: AI-2E family transporter [Gemmatimonadaceae bacterium]